MGDALRGRRTFVVTPIASLGVVLTYEDPPPRTTFWRPWRNAWLPIDSPLTAVMERLNREYER